MEYSKFSLGLRFAMTRDADLNPEGCWNIAFSQVPITHAVGATLFGAWDDVGSAESESAYICMFSNLPRKVGKALFQQLRQKPVLLSYLTIYRPFIQNNLVERCSVVDYLGSVSENGTVTGGDVSYGAMKIMGALPETCDKLTTCRRILIAPNAWAGKFTSADAARHMLRSAAKVIPQAKLSTQLIADGGQGTLDALVCSVNGRYGKGRFDGKGEKSREIQYGILPDRTVVLESETLSKEELAQALDLPQNKGYTNYIIAAGNGILPKELPQGLSAAVLAARIPDKQQNSGQIEYRNGIETVLEIGEFDFHLSNADWLIALTRLLDDAGSRHDPTTDALLYHCRALNKHYAVLAFTQSGKFFAQIDDSPLVPIEADSFDEAANALFLIIRNTSNDPVKTTRVAQAETVINDM